MRLSRFDRSQIKENLRHLRQLERQHAGSPAQERLTAFALLKSEPSLTLAEAGERLGRSERTVQRWIDAYRRGGLPELLNPKIRPGRPKRLQDEALSALKSELQNSRLAELTDVQVWLRERFGLDFSRSGIWYMMRRDLNAVPRGWVTVHGESEGADRSKESLDSVGIVTRVTHFLNALPTTGHPVQWMEGFREALVAFLGDVDRVSLNVDFNMNLRNPEEYRVAQRIIHHRDSTSARFRMAMAVGHEVTERPSVRILRDAKQAGFPVDSFHEPTTWDFYLAEHAYLGSLFLWRKRDESPISEATIGTVEGLAPFLRFVLSDIISRNRAARPIDAVFGEAIKRMNEEADLSSQEQRIALLQLMGHSYKEMADILSITVDGIKKHFTKIHKKTGTRSQSELFAKYFAFQKPDAS